MSISSRVTHQQYLFMLYSHELVINIFHYDYFITSYSSIIILTNSSLFLFIQLFLLNMGCWESVHDDIPQLYPIDISQIRTITQAIENLPNTPLKDQLQSREVSAVRLGQDGEKVVVDALRRIINSLQLPFRIKHVSQEDYCADIQLECLINDMIILVEVKNKLSITNTLFDTLDHPKGDVNKFDRDLYLAATHHPTAHIEGIFISLVSDFAHDFLHKNVKKIADTECTEQQIAKTLLELLRKYPRTEDTWIFNNREITIE